MTLTKRSLLRRTLTGILATAFLATGISGSVSAQGTEAAKKKQVRMTMSPGAAQAEKESAKLGRPASSKITKGEKQVAHPGKPSKASKVTEALLGFDPVPTAEGFLALLEKGERAPTPKEIAGLPTIEEKLGLPARSQETVFGTDNRRKVNSTHRAPWRMNCLLIMKLKDGSYARGTGFLIGNRSVMTAGHCVHSGGRRGNWAERIWVYPGYNNGKRPYGVHSSTRFYSNSIWTGRKSTKYDPNYDYGCIILGSDVGKRTGYYGFTNYGARSLRNMRVNSAGYPADKPNYTMWRFYGPISRVTSQLVYYRMDHMGGQSGSAIYRKNRRGRYVVSILVAESPSWNYGQRVNSGVYRFMRQMRSTR